MSARILQLSLVVGDPSRIESAREAATLAEGDALHRVSIYVPVDLAGRERGASELRLRAALERGRERLAQRGVRDEERDARFERATTSSPGLEALEHGTRTLALFGDDAGWAWASLLEEVDRVTVAAHYALRPLLHAFQREGRIRVLVVSPNHVAAYEGNARGLWPLPIAGLPRSLEDALGTQIEGGELSHRSDHPIPGQRSPGAIYFGSTGSDAGREVDRERFCRAVAGPVNRAWRSSDVPVVLAADVQIAGELRKMLGLPNLLEGHVSGSPPEEGPDALHGRVVPHLEAALAARERERAQAFEQARQGGKGLDGDLAEIARAALAGRVRRLWVEVDARVPGRLDPLSAGSAPASDPDEDVLDALVAHVLRRGGEVYGVEEGGTPTGGAFCAQLR